MRALVVAGALVAAVAAVRAGVSARAARRTARRFSGSRTGVPHLPGAEPGAGAGWWGERVGAAVPGRWIADPLGRARRRRAEELPLLADDIAGALRSGSSVSSALREVAERSGNPTAGELRPVVARIEGGEPLVVALRWWAGRSDREVGLLTAALSLGADAGGSRARSVDRVAATLRERHAVDSELRALSATARTSAGVLVAVPPVFTALAAAVDPRTATFLFTEPVGLACVAAAILLDLGGAVWMARITGGLW